MDFNRDKQLFFAEMMCNWPRHLKEFKALQDVVDEQIREEI